MYQLIIRYRESCRKRTDLMMLFMTLQAIGVWLIFCLIVRIGFYLEDYNSMRSRNTLSVFIVIF